MTSRLFNYSIILLLGVAALFVQSCDDDHPSLGKGEVSFEITDAPSDDTDIKGVFVTVSDIKVDGKSIGLQDKQTIELSAYANGQTKLLGTSNLDAKTYNSITLVLDNATDANGDTPGNYVLSTTDAKYKLTETTTGTTDITITKSVAVVANASESIVLDFDLRKAIRHSSTTGVEYQFVGENDLNTAVRALDKSNTGKIDGTYQESFATNADMIIVYAYKKGEFNQSTETTADENGLTFKNAIASAVVSEGLSDTYSLHFIEEGEYELAFAAYDKNATTNQFELNTLLDADLSVGGSLVATINVDAQTSVDVSATIIGLL